MGQYLKHHSLESPHALVTFEDFKRLKPEPFSFKITQCSFLLSFTLVWIDLNYVQEIF